MPENIASIVIASLFLGLGLLAAVRTVSKLLQSRYGPIRTVKAVVADKQTVETFSKYSGTGKSVKYMVIFLVDGKKKSFYVSQFSYNGYRINEKGTLKYRGDRLIGFK